MGTYFARMSQVVLFLGLLLIFLQAAAHRATANTLAGTDTQATLPSSYGIVAPGLWEAECATLTGSWTLKNAARGSKQSCDSTHSYIESTDSASKVCLNFKNADRVGVGYVAGNYKGKVHAVVTFTDGTPSVTLNFNTYSSYIEAQPSGNAPLVFDDNFQEGDLDSSGASNATQTFHAFNWIWEQDDQFANKNGTLCINPRNLLGVTGGSAMVSLDYFVTARDVKMAVRGIGTEFTPMTQAHVNADWNYNATNFKLPDSSTTSRSLAPVNAANWDGFIPKISGTLSKQMTTSTVLDIITNTRTTATGVPKYWIVFNEEDNAQWFPNGTQPDPASSYYINLLLDWMHLVINTYQQAGEIPPKFIIESGSQFHAPSLENAAQSGTWGPQGSCDTRGNNWGCTHLNSVWIHEFWGIAKPRLNTEGLLPYIGGFGGHYYQSDDNNCYNVPDCWVKSDKVTSFAQALKNWATQYSAISNPEIWIIETSSHLPPYCGAGTSVNQRDLQKCTYGNKTYTLNVRNYIGVLQDELTKQGIVNRWAWYADRYGRTNECTVGTNGQQDDTPDGEDAALNATCDTITLSPFGNNFQGVTQYR